MDNQKKELLRERILVENPYDIETFLEAILIASDSGKEVLFLDKFIATLRAYPRAELIDLNYNVLQELDLI